MIQLEKLVIEALQQMEQEHNKRYEELTVRLSNLDAQLNYFAEVFNALSTALEER